MVPFWETPGPGLWYLGLYEGGPGSWKCLKRAPLALSWEMKELDGHQKGRIYTVPNEDPKTTAPGDVRTCARLTKLQLEKTASLQHMPNDGSSSSCA